MSISEHYAKRDHPERKTPPGHLHLEAPDCLEMRIIAFRKGRLGGDYVDVEWRTTTGTPGPWNSRENLRAGDTVSLSLTWNGTP